MRVQLTRRGAAIDASAADIRALQQQFHEQHHVLFRQFLEPDLLQQLQVRIGAAAFHDRDNPHVGPEVRMATNPASTALEFLMNDPALHAFVRDITAIGPIGCFQGRVYSLLPNTNQRSDWHSDVVSGRMATHVINLSTEVYEGGVLQFRRSGSDAIDTEVHNTGFGDATLFRVAHGLEHRVTPTVGHYRRTVYAGWFRSEPSFQAELRTRLRVSAAVSPAS